MEKERYQDIKRMTFDLMRGSYERDKDSIEGACGYVVYTCFYEADYDVPEMERLITYVAMLLFEVEHNDVEDEAEANATYLIYKYDRDKEFRNKLSNFVEDIEVLEADIAKIKSMRELYYGGFEAAGL